MDKLLLVGRYEQIMEHDKWWDEIPFINFPNWWQIQITPPRNGAVVRFRVKYAEAKVSVYLDCYDQLGYFGEPYWEMYPSGDGCFRCKMNETNELIKAIKESLKEQQAEILKQKNL